MFVVCVKEGECEGERERERDVSSNSQELNFTFLIHHVLRRAIEGSFRIWCGRNRTTT